jgi:hypothetical protein
MTKEILHNNTKTIDSRTTGKILLENLFSKEKRNIYNFNNKCRLSPETYTASMMGEYPRG